MLKLATIFLLTITFASSPLFALKVFKPETLKQLKRCSSKEEIQASSFLSQPQKDFLSNIDYTSVATLIPALHAHKYLSNKKDPNLTNQEITDIYTHIITIIFGQPYADRLPTLSNHKDLIFEHEETLLLPGNKRDRESIKSLTTYLNIACTPSNGITFLHDAIILQCSNTVKFLLQCSTVDLNAQDSEGWTPLHYAVSEIKTKMLQQEQNNKDIHEDISILTMLLEKGCDPNRQDFKGSSPLYYALAANLPVTAQVLIAKKANPYLLNFEGLTPAHWFYLNQANYCCSCHLVKKVST